MKIVIIADCYPPSNLSGAIMIQELAAELYGCNHEVTVVVPDNNVSMPKSISVENNIKCIRVRSGKIKGVNRFVRALNELRLSSVIWNACKDYFRTNPHEFVIFYSPSIFFGPLVIKLKKLWYCTSYLILRDIFPQWALDTGVIRKGPIYLFFKLMELIQYKAADTIGIESTGYLPYFSRNRIDNICKIELLPNWISLKPKYYPAEDHRKRLGLDGKFVFFYGGNIGIAQEMENIVTLAEKLRNRSDIHFLLVGDGTEVNSLRSMIKQKMLENITIHPSVSQDRYFGMLSQFDVGLVCLNRKLKAHNFPGKMLGYMYFAKPILASINPGNDLASFMQKNNVGLFSISGDDDQLYRNALRLIEDKHLTYLMGQNSRNLLEKHFSVENIASTILANADKT